MAPTRLRKKTTNTQTALSSFCFVKTSINIQSQNAPATRNIPRTNNSPTPPSPANADRRFIFLEITGSGNQSSALTRTASICRSSGGGSIARSDHIAVRRAYSERRTSFGVELSPQVRPSFTAQNCRRAGLLGSQVPAASPLRYRSRTSWVYLRFLC